MRESAENQNLLGHICVQLFCKNETVMISNSVSNGRSSLAFTADMNIFKDGEAEDRP